jgi:hypothetical protein
MKKDDFMKLVDEIISTCNKEIENAKKRNTEAAQSFIYYRNLFLDDISEKKKMIETKRNDLETELNMFVECEHSIKDSYASVIASGDNEGIKYLESEMKAIAGDIAFCMSKIDLLNAHTEKGDRKLFDAAYTAYQQQKEVEDKSTHIVAECEKMLNEAIEKLNGLKKEFRYLPTYDNDKAMVNMFETINGPIDITGHHAGTDMAAKVRIINNKSI